MSNNTNGERRTSASKERQYHGYQTIAEEDLAPQNPNLQRQRINLFAWLQSGSLKLKLLSLVLFISFLLLLVWQVLLGNCRVSTLCNLIDSSSLQDSSYNFRTFRFLLPSSLVWSGLTSGSLLIFLSSLITIHLTKRPITSYSIQYVSYFIRQAANAILLTQYIVMIIPTFIIFLIIGLSINWSTAGSFSFGSLTCTMAAHLAISVSTKVHIHSPSRSSMANDSDSFNRAILAALTLFSTTVGLAGLACSTGYLLYSDIQAMAGFIGGSSFASFFLYTSSTLSFDSMATGFKFKPPFREVLRPNVVAIVAYGVSLVTGITSDTFSSFVLCTIATAILGSGLPFFENNQFALCVFNHLIIDQVCGPFGYPENISFASVICKSDNFYLLYPTLDSQNSVSRFVSIPFLLFAGALGAYFLSSFFIYAYSKWIRREQPNTGGSSYLQTFKSLLPLSTIICGILLVASSSAIFFGLFGRSSHFQQSELHGFRQDIPRKVLDGSLTQCLVDVETLPQGIELDNGYEPMFPSGYSYGSIGSIPLRLFGCNCIGICAGVLISLFTMLSYFSKPPDTSDLGSTTVMFQRFSNSLLIQMPTTIIILLSLVIPFKLYGSFGVGIAAIGYISSTGVALVARLVAILWINTEGSASSTRINAPDQSAERRHAKELYNFTTSNAHVLSNGTSVLCTLTGVFTVVQKAGLWLSPRALAGSPIIPSLNLIFYKGGVLLRNVFVVASMFAGSLLPILLAALFITASFRSGLAIYVYRRLGSQIGISTSTPLTAKIIVISLQEGAFIFILSIIGPLCIGFGFGQRGLVSSLLGFIIIGFILGATFGAPPIRNTASESVRAGEIIRPSKQNMAPCLQGAVKVSVSLSLLMCTLMQDDNQRGWIGVILFCFMIIFLILLAFWSHRRFKQTIMAARQRDEPNKWQAPDRKVSPFYEGNNTLDAGSINPASYMAELMKHLGIQNEEPLTAIKINMDNGSVNLLNSQTDSNAIIIPQQGSTVLEEVVLDDVRQLNV